MRGVSLSVITNQKWSLRTRANHFFVYSLKNRLSGCNLGGKGVDVYITKYCEKTMIKILFTISQYWLRAQGPLLNGAVCQIFWYSDKNIDIIIAGYQCWIMGAEILKKSEQWWPRVIKYNELAKVKRQLRVCYLFWIVKLWFHFYQPRCF